jgi:hypothetical protein
VYPAVYDWYRGDQPVVASAKLVQSDPLIVEVKTASGQGDTYRLEGEAFSVVSRDGNGVRFAQLSGGVKLEAEGIILKTGMAKYETPVVSADYTTRRFTIRDAMPVFSGATVGSEGKRNYYVLKGQGREFLSVYSLLDHEGKVTKIEVIDNDNLTVETNQELFAADTGNRKRQGFVLTTEDHAWQFRTTGKNTYRVIARPGTAPLTPAVFTDANGDGLIHAKTYKIGVGDTVELPASVIVRRTADGFEVMTNVPVAGRVEGVTIALKPSIDWQKLNR